MFGITEENDVPINEADGNALEVIIIAAILLLFLRATGKRESDLTRDDLSLLDEFYEQARDSIAKIIARTGRNVSMGPTITRIISFVLRIYYIGLLGYGDDEDKFIWEYGDTEHCNDCLSLNEQVHTRREWYDFFLRTGKFPRSSALECKGHHCACNLNPTQRPVTGDLS